MIRLAKSSDVATIINLNKECLKHYKWSYNKDYVRRSVHYGNHYVICKNNEILGAIKFYYERNWLWISTMAIFKKYQGNGYAKRLLEFTKFTAKRMNYNKIRLDTLTISKVGKFYTKMGYTLIEQGPYYGKTYQVYEKLISNHV